MPLRPSSGALGRVFRPSTSRSFSQSFSRSLISSRVQSLNSSTAPPNTFRPLAYPDLQSLTPPKGSSPKKKGPRRTYRALIVVLAASAGLYAYDRYANASAIARAARCAYHLTIVGLDYKWNFAEGKDIEALHARSAERIYHLLITNKGLYIKIGQMMAIQQGVFPPVFQEKLSRLFDAAPQDPWYEVDRILRQDFGRAPEEIFEEFDRVAVASASIAQVYRARLRGSGREVAVKVQHADLAKQLGWDLWAYKTMMLVFERFLFELPISFIAQHVAERVALEADFQNEAVNNLAMASHLAQASPSLRGRAYIPQVIPELCSRRVMVSEWIEGVRLSDKDQLRAQGFDVRAVVDTVLKLYGQQIFSWGVVHCDPHPGNIIVRRVAGRMQVVLIDHGLHIAEADEFRRQYAQLWQGLFTLDRQLVQGVAAQWGFGDSEMFADAMTNRRDPMHGHSHDPKKANEGEQGDKNNYQEQQAASDRFRRFVRDTTKMPLELIFLGRTMRILQGINKMFGSPVNRLRSLAWDAAQSLRAANARDLSLTGRLRALRDYCVFVAVVFASDLGFSLVRVYQLFSGRGAEDLLEDTARSRGFDVSSEEY